MDNVVISADTQRFGADGASAGTWYCGILYNKSGFSAFGAPDE